MLGAECVLPTPATEINGYQYIYHTPSIELFLGYGGVKVTTWKVKGQAAVRYSAAEWRGLLDTNHCDHYKLGFGQFTIVKRAEENIIVFIVVGQDEFLTCSRVPLGKCRDAIEKIALAVDAYQSHSALHRKIKEVFERTKDRVHTELVTAEMVREALVKSDGNVDDAVVVIIKNDKKVLAEITALAKNHEEDEDEEDEDEADDESQ